jgi:tRNA (guanine9-N1)-methyltransferase
MSSETEVRQQSHRSLKRKRRKERKRNEKLENDSAENPVKHERQLLYESLSPEEKRAFIEQAVQNKRIRTEEEINRLKSSMTSGDPIFVVNCGFTEFMSEKEISSLAKQLLLCYSTWKKTDKISSQFHITGLKSDDSQLYQKLRQQQHCDKWFCGIHKEDFIQMEPISHDKQICYLSPDGEEYLTDIQPNTVYVIGGIVDKSVKPNLSLNNASPTGNKTYRLPLQGIVEKRVLNINTVFDILLAKAANSQDCWSEIIRNIVPSRKLYK